MVCGNLYCCKNCLRESSSTHWLANELLQLYQEEMKLLNFIHDIGNLKLLQNHTIKEIRSLQGIQLGNNENKEMKFGLNSIGKDPNANVTFSKFN